MAKEPQIFLDGEKPFETTVAAEKYIEENNLDTKTNEVVEVEQGGFAVQGDGKKAKAQKQEKWVEEFWWVRFHAKSNANDPEDVSLSVNGETLVVQRNTDVCVASRFLECADNGVYNTYRQEPGKSRKVSGTVQHFPYTRIKQGTREEFLKQRDDGTKQTKINVKRFGYDASPDDIGDI